MGVPKCSKIRCIVRLRQMLRRWRARASSRTAHAPPDVPAGHVAVCVAGGSHRFVVRAVQLNHPAFRQLLRQAEEEYGFPSAAAGPLALPCDEALFRAVLRHVSASNRSVDIDELQKKGACGCGCAGRWQGEALPLLQSLSNKSVW